MLDYTQIDYIIRKKNYCLWKVRDNKFDIIKNEHGTFGEHFDFIISVKIDINTMMVKSWTISNTGTSDDNHIQEVEFNIKSIINNKDILFETLCYEIADKI